MARLVADGHWQVPGDWPKWKKRCSANRHGGTPCMQWCVVGMPTCKYHGSGGKKNKELGFLRYLCWVITGGPQNMPVEAACRVALTVFAEAVLNKGQGTLTQKMQAATMITQMLD